MRLSNWGQRLLDARWSEDEDRREEAKERLAEWHRKMELCAVCDHIRALHELPFVETSHVFVPRANTEGAT